jgi:myosin heavy subunit
MENLKSSKAIAVVTTALLLASLVWLLNTNRVNSSLEAGLEKERLKSESMLSEKLLLEKELDKFKDQLFKLKDKNLELDNLVKNTSSQFSRQESEYNRMKKENLTLAQIKKQRQDLVALRSQLENELQSLKSTNAELEEKNREMNNTIASLQDRNRILSEDLNRAMLAAVDQSQIQALRGKNERLTVRAKKTKKLMATFEVAANLKNLSFKIIDSKRNLVSTETGSIAYNVMPSESSLTASASEEVTASKLQKVELAFTPQKKLTPGVYTIEILNENLYVGSLRVKLR